MSPLPSNPTAVQAYLHLFLELFRQILLDSPTAAVAGTVPLTWLLLFHTGNGKFKSDPISKGNHHKPFSNLQNTKQKIKFGHPGALPDKTNKQTTKDSLRSPTWK